MKTSRVLHMVAGISLNGKIADASGSFSKISSPEDHAWLQKKIQESDLLIMGRKTYELHAGKIRKPLIVISRTRRPVNLSDQRNHIVHRFFGSRADLIHVLDLLQCKKVTILGGAEVYHWCIDQKITTDIFLTVEPMLIGEGKNMLEGSAFSAPQSWTLESSKILNKHGTLLLHYRP